MKQCHFGYNVHSKSHRLPNKKPRTMHEKLALWLLVRSIQEIPKIIQAIALPLAFLLGSEGESLL